MSGGWDESAAGWIDQQSEGGDFLRSHVLDAPMRERVLLSGARNALDVGCGEGRFCRMMGEMGLRTTGLDPTDALRERAKALDPEVTYVKGIAEDMPFGDAQFDLVVSYMSLIDIPDMDKGIAEMARVLAPGGRLLVANLQSYATAWDEKTLEKRIDGSVTATMHDYFHERGTETQWSRIRIVNYHRPLARYMQAFMAQGFNLTHFAEPMATCPDAGRARRYNGAPWALIMEWQKP